VVKRQAFEPILITDASRSQDDQLQSRQVRYLVMMGIRVLCLVVGATLVVVEAPMLWLWLPLCGVGMILVPWLAVILVNDRPPKDKHRLAYRFRRRAASGSAPRSLSAEERPHRIIDAEP